MKGTLWRCAGPRNTEEALLCRARELLRWSGGLLPRLLVVVPSSALRVHVAARSAAALRGCALGVEVVTAYGLAERICLQAGEQPELLGPLFGLLARRAAAREPALAEILGQLDDGYAAVVGSCRDLSSARLEAACLGPLARCWRSAGAAGERGLALARVMLAVREQLSMLGLTRTTEVYGRAARLLDGGAELPGGPQHVLIHGFVDVTGQTRGLLEALLERGAELFFDEPTEPRDVTAGEVGDRREEAFGRRLRRALQPRLGAERRVEEQLTLALPQCLSAVGLQAETQEVARRVAEALDRGVVPERIAVVARDLPRYAVALRGSFSELGVPFSGPLAPAGLFPLQRRFRAALELLARGGEASLETWLQAAPRAPLLRLALRSLGMLRLGDVAALDVEAVLCGAEAFALPTRAGVALDEEDGLLRARVERQALPAAVLRDAVSAARSCLAVLESWPTTSPLAQAADRCAAWLVEELQWPADSELFATVIAPLRAVDTAVTRAELPLLMGELGAAVGVEPLGGAGAGVQVMDATHARGLTFEELFLLGCNRGVMPRALREDPLLPDELRRRARAVLPDLSPKARSRLEERHLFAQLLAAAPRVTLCWQRADEDGRALFASPLVERLRHGGAPLVVERVPRLHWEALSPPHAGGHRRPRAARELGILTSLAARREELSTLWSAGGVSDDAPLLAARLAALDELDPDLRSAAGRARALAPGPLLGFIGSLQRPDDPRRTALYVTTLEDLARCPWKALLEDVLRLSAPPDPRDALPGIDPPLLGQVVHLALETLVAPQGDRREREGARGAGWAVQRPGDARVQHHVEQAVAAASSERGLMLPGLRRALERRVTPLVQRAVGLDWPHTAAQLDVVGTEQQRGIEIADGEGRPRRVRFTADRIDRQSLATLPGDGPAGGTLVLSDYKTGRPFSSGRRSETRRRELRRAVARGERLQVAAYAAVAEGAVGRYVFLDPSLSDDEAVTRLDAGDRAVRVVLPRVLRDLIAAWESGVFSPRLEDARGDEPRSCGRCAVAEACYRGDSTVRARLRSLAEDSRGGGVALWESGFEGRALVLLAALWFLGAEADAAGEGDR